MSINNSYGIQVIESDGITKRHAFSFFINRREDLKIEVIDTNNSITNLIYGVDYTVENKFDYYDGGYFNLNRAEPVGYSIVVYRETPISQEFNFLSLQAISPTNLTSIFDKLTVISQEINAQLGRTAKFDFEGISLIDQNKPLNEANIKNLNTEINESKVVALTLRYNSTSRKWELYTSKTDPDDKKEQGTEDKLGVYRIATQNEVSNGTNDNRVITPLKLKTELNSRKANSINEDDQYKYTNAKQVRDYMAEKVIVATQEEVTNGSNDTKFLTPLKLKSELDTRQASDMEVGTGSNLKKYINPRQLNDYLAEKVVIATQSDIITGTNDSKFITPLKLKTEIDRRKADNINEEDLYKYVNAKQVRDYMAEKVIVATQEEVTNGSNDTKFLTPLKLKSELNIRQSTDTEINSSSDVKKYINPKQFNTTILKYSNTRTYLKGDMCYQLDSVTSKPYIYYSLTDNNLNNPLTNINHWKSFDINGENLMQIATQDEVTIGVNDEKAISPLKLKNELDNRIASSTELNNGSDIKKYINPKQLMDVMGDRNRLILKRSFSFNSNISDISFTDLDNSVEHIFVMSDLLSTATTSEIFCRYGTNSTWLTTSKYSFESSTKNSGENTITNTSGYTWSCFCLSHQGNANGGLRNDIPSMFEFHLYPSTTGYRFMTSMLITSTSQAATIKGYRVSTSGVFYDSNTVSKMILWLPSTTFAAGKVKHYIVK